MLLDKLIFGLILFYGYLQLRFHGLECMLQSLYFVVFIQHRDVL